MPVILVLKPNRMLRQGKQGDALSHDFKGITVRRTDKILNPLTPTFNKRLEGTKFQTKTRLIFAQG